MSQPVASSSPVTLPPICAAVRLVPPSRLKLVGVQAGDAARVAPGMAATAMVAIMADAAPRLAMRRGVMNLDIGGPPIGLAVGIDDIPNPDRKERRVPPRAHAEPSSIDCTIAATTCRRRSARWREDVRPRPTACARPCSVGIQPGASRRYDSASPSMRSPETRSPTAPRPAGTTGSGDRRLADRAGEGAPSSRGRRRRHRRPRQGDGSRHGGRESDRTSSIEHVHQARPLRGGTTPGSSVPPSSPLTRPSEPICSPGPAAPDRGSMQRPAEIQQGLEANGSRRSR